MTDADGHAVRTAKSSSEQSKERPDAVAPPVTSAPYEKNQDIPEKVNGLCTDNGRIFGGVAATALIQGIINDYVARANKYENDRDALRGENADLRVENERLKTHIERVAFFEK